MNDDELEAIRQRKLAALQEQALRKQQEEERRQQAEAQIQAILRGVLTEEARARLQNIKLVKPELAQAVEYQLATLAQSGRLQGKITDDQLKALLKQIQEKKRETKIRFKRV